MQIGNPGQVKSSFAIDQLKKLNETPKADNTSVKQPIKSDGISLSKIATQKAPATQSVKHSLSGLGEKLFNNPILDHYKSFRNDPNYQPIIAKVDEVAKNGGSVKDLEKTAFAAVRERNPNDSKSEVLAKGYRAILASVIPNHYSDPKFFNGEKDKIFHYFVSSSMTVDAFNGMKYSLFMPDAMKRSVAGASVITLGFLKEVGSIPGNGYGADDMMANRAGIASAKEYLKQ